jgi:hypothetical protein
MGDGEGGLLQGRGAIAFAQGDYQPATVVAEGIGDAMNAAPEWQAGSLGWWSRDLVGACPLEGCVRSVESPQEASSCPWHRPVRGLDGALVAVAWT